MGAFKMSKLFQPFSKVHCLRPALAACLFAAACFSSPNYANSAEQLDLALTRLAKVDLFAFGGVGISGLTSQGEKDYQEIVARPSGEADFEKLYAIGTLEAKCYALVGIRKLNEAKFNLLSSPLRSSRRQVSTMLGCLMWRTSINVIVERIRAGRYATQ